ncbi:MAG: murein transglycosylase A [Magnetococcales bacterium]|nr:murein transglycosylase A [Magnetococcales bacterium]
MRNRTNSCRRGPPYHRWFTFVMGFVLVLLLVRHFFPPVDEPPPKQQQTGPVLEERPWSDLPALLETDDGLAAWAQALRGSAGYYAKRPDETPFTFSDQIVTANDLEKACLDLANIAENRDFSTLKSHLEKNYRLYQSIGAEKYQGVMVTAYYEPLLQGSRHPDAQYKYPLYKKPDSLLQADLGAWYPDLKGKKITARVDNGRLKPFFTREEIDSNSALKEQDLELVYSDDLGDVFFLHIQGSGRVLLTDGSTMRVGYAGANGHGYRSIGGLLIKEGKMTKAEMSLQSLRAWLDAHPEEVSRIYNANPSYVFFRELTGEKGPLGNIQVPLTAGRSIATDYRLFPRGAPAILVTELPEVEKGAKEVNLAWKKTARFVVNQDTGGAIRGAGRVDLFTGFGDEAEMTAGLMKQKGSRLYFIVPQ